MSPLTLEFDGKIACVDLFCGVGGLSYGLKKEGINVVAGVDLDESCRYAYEHNNQAQFLLQDVCSISAEQIDQLFAGAEIRVLAGCAPCQPFSSYSQRYQTIGTPRWGLLYQFAKLVREVIPEVVIMENVPSITRHKVFLDFLKSLEAIGYKVSYEIIDCAKYGLPQKRKRAVLLASLLGSIEKTGLEKQKSKDVRSAIGKLPKLSAGAVDPKDPIHKSASLSSLNTERIKVSKPGGTWHDWPEHLVAECHRRSTGRKYTGVYSRMSWNEPSPTLTTQFYNFGSGRFGHPEQDRAISLREGAILQGFPENYIFSAKDDPVEIKTIGRLIGNAVPVTLGRAIGQAINFHLGIRRSKERVESGILLEDKEVSKSLYLHKKFEFS